MIGLSALLFTQGSLAQETLQPLTVIGSSDQSEGFNADDLKLLQIVKTKDLLGQAPGVSSVASGAAGYGDVVGVRGTGNTSFFGPAGVGMMIDDVPLSDVFTYPTDFYDLSSLHLHRGPQGAYFGQNGAAGMLELRTIGLKDRAPNQFSISAGKYNELGLRLRYAEQLNDSIGLSFQSYYNERDGFIKHALTGDDVDERKRFGVLGNVYLTPSDDTEMKVRFLYEQVRDGGVQLSPIPISQGYFGSPFAVGSNVAGETNFDRLQLSFHYERDLGWAALQSITSFQRWDLGPQIVDLDFSPFDVADSTIAQAQNYWTQEFRLGTDSGPFSWNTGAFFSFKNDDGVATRGIPLNPFNPLAGQFFETTRFDREEMTVAIYGNTTWALNSQVDLTAGARLQYVDTDMVRTKDINGVSTNNDLTGSSSDWYFAPTLGMNYEVSDAVSFFARSSIGIKPAGYTAYTDDVLDFSFRDESAWENEIGMRHEFTQGSLELRGYHKQIDDYQLNRSVVNTTNFIVANAGEVDALGVEVEVAYQPINRLSLYATAGWNETIFNQGMTDGNQVPFMPDFTASVGFDCQIGNGYFLAASARFVGDTFYDENESAFFQQSSYRVIDAQVGYKSEDWSLVLYGRNIFDEEYYSFVNSQIFAGSPGDPTVVGVRYERRF